MQTETDRYAVWPGQACGYMVGHERIVAMRDKARATLGDKLDEKAFHDVLIGGGAMPLTLLEQRVDRFIAAAQR